MNIWLLSKLPLQMTIRKLALLATPVMHVVIFTLKAIMWVYRTKNVYFCLSWVRHFGVIIVIISIIPNGLWHRQSTSRENTCILHYRLMNQRNLRITVAWNKKEITSAFYRMFCNFEILKRWGWNKKKGWGQSLWNILETQRFWLALWLVFFTYILHAHIIFKIWFVLDSSSGSLFLTAFRLNSTMHVCKYGTLTRCNNNSFIDLQDQLNMFRARFCPSSGAQDWDFLQHMV
jgi:hypothetical protein